MINTFLFESDSPLLPGDYLLGSPTWPTPMGLINVRLTCKAGASVTRTVGARCQDELGVPDQFRDRRGIRVTRRVR